MDFREHHLFQILKRFQLENCPLDLFLSRYYREHKALGSKDRRFVSEAIYGMIRWQALLDHLCWHEPTWEKRYFLYKTLQPAEYKNRSDIPWHIRLSFPQDLFELLVAQYGEEKAVDLAEVFNSEAPITIRANSLKISREDLLTRFADQEAVATRESPFGINFKKRAAFFETPEFQEGYFEMQDEGSQLVALEVAASPKNKILDYCAGSGGKTLAFAHKLQGSGQIYLHDIRPSVLEQAKKRLCRAGIQNAQVLPADHPYLPKLKKGMDWVLVDAPCSGTGTFRRNPEMKWRFTKATLQELLGMQRNIFEKALSYCRKGGKIIYATCSILQEENERQVDHFLKTYPLKLVKEPLVILPARGSMDGFFSATFETI